MFSFIHLLPLFFFLSLATAYDVRPTFNVLSYGANPNRFTENSNAFLRAWHDACASNTGGRVLVPRGSYVLGGGCTCMAMQNVWHLNDCAKNSHCKQLPYTMRFDFVKNSRIEHINSVNSRSGHFDLFSCYNVEMSYIRISAPYPELNPEGPMWPGHGFSIGSLGSIKRQIRNVTFRKYVARQVLNLQLKLP
ncbi:exopolygalacturonase-like protein [Tanacetum coccineum]|uniref:Exopolygalacturonase-like protein n=1 Tax=Tanacetum coccineum TaxID=301880 RepID=A0ABQ5GC14_9ASTR